MINCEFSIPKTLCSNVVQRLGVENDVELLLDRLGIYQFVTNHVPTYAELTYEFWSSVQFHSVAQLCPVFCDPMDCSMPGFPVHHQLPELAQTQCPSSW